MRYLPIVGKLQLVLHFCILLLLLSCSIAAAAYDGNKRDTIFMRSGEILIGDIKEMKLGLVTIDSKDVGLINIKVSKINTISTASDTLRIETTNRAIYYGALRASNEEGKAYIVTEVRRHLVSIDDINTMVTLHKSFLNKLQGSLSSGFSFSHSSGIGQLSLNGNVEYHSKYFEVDLTFSSMSSIDTSTFSRDREEIKLTTNYNLKNKLYLVSSVDYQRNIELSIARRFVETAGPGLKFILSPNVQIITYTGLSVNQELSTSGEQQNWLFELPTGFRFDYFKFSHPNIQFTSSNSFYVSFSQWGRIRYDNNNTISWEIIHNFSLSLNFYMNYDRRPPDNSDTGKVDYGTVVGFGYKF